jgi:lysophospholipase L1-like esterase
MKKHVLGLTVSIAIICVGFPIIELALRFIDQPINDYRPRHISLRERSPLINTMVQPTPSAIANADNIVIKPYRVRTDRDGFILGDQLYPDAQYKIVFLGGSTTECRYVEEDARFPARIGDISNKNKLHVQTYNAGHWGNNTAHSIDILFNKAAKLKPDVAVMMHNINDLTMLVYKKDYWDRHASRELIKASPAPTLWFHAKGVLKSTLPYLYRRLRHVFSSTSSLGNEFDKEKIKPIKVDLENVAALYAANLKIFISMSRHLNIKPVLMTQANRFQTSPDPFIASKWKSGMQPISYKDYHSAYVLLNKTTRLVGRQTNTPVIDLAKKIPKDKIYICDEVHLTSKGSTLVAEIVSDRIQSLLAS